jgi:hypothetical protein
MEPHVAGRQRAARAQGRGVRLRDRGSSGGLTSREMHERAASPDAARCDAVSPISRSPGRSPSPTTSSRTHPRWCLSPPATSATVPTATILVTRRVRPAIPVRVVVAASVLPAAVVVPAGSHAGARVEADDPERCAGDGGGTGDCGRSRAKRSARDSTDRCSSKPAGAACAIVAPRNSPPRNPAIAGPALDCRTT